MTQGGESHFRGPEGRQLVGQALRAGKCQRVKSERDVALTPTVMLYSQVEPVFGQPGAPDFLATTLADPLGETGARLSSRHVRLVRGASVLVPVSAHNVLQHRSGRLQVVLAPLQRVCVVTFVVGVTCMFNGIRRGYAWCLSKPRATRTIGIPSWHQHSDWPGAIRRPP